MTKRWPGLLLCLVLLAGGLTRPAPAYSETQRPRAPAGSSVNLSLDQVRALALEAVKQGDYGLAIELARGLVQANNKDPFAYFVLSMAHGQLGDAYLSRRAAGYAFRYSDASPDRFQAGQLAARAAFQEERYSLAQYWLRRTAIHASTDAQKSLVAQDYTILRQINPWSVSIQANLRPSSNVNNGSEDALQIIEGVPVTGILSGTAQALSGIIGTLDVVGRYRLRRDETSASHLGLRAYTRHVALSGEAQALAPTARNSDFSSQFVEASLGHRFKVNQGSAGGNAAIGQAWYGNNPTYRFLRLSADRSWDLENKWYGIGGSVEDRSGVRLSRYDATAVSLSFRAGRKLNNGDRINLSLGLRDTDSSFVNDISQGISLRTGYTFANPMGPVAVNLALTLGYSDYPFYRSGLIIVPGGRQDQSAYADVNLIMQDWDYAGFVPTVRIRAGKSESNDSRFDTRELSVGFGIQSKF